MHTGDAPGLPVDFQVRHLFAMGNVDDILIANAYASEEEMKACAGINPSVLTFGLCLEKKLTKTEQAVLDFSKGHVVRGDMSDYMLRSTWPRTVLPRIRFRRKIPEIWCGETW